MKFKYPTPDKTYFKILSEYAKYSENGSTRDVVWNVVFPGKATSHDIDEFKALLSSGTLAYLGKNGRKDVHHITEKGISVVEYAMQYKDICEFVELANVCRSFPEFKIHAVLKMKHNLATKEFYDTNISLIAKGISISKIDLDLGNEYVDNEKVSKHLFNKIKKIPWFDDYVKEMNAE